MKPNILYKFIQRSRDKFLQTGSVVKIRKGSNKILQQTAMKIKRLALMTEEHQEGGGHGGGVCHDTEQYSQEV